MPAITPSDASALTFSARTAEELAAISVARLPEMTASAARALDSSAETSAVLATISEEMSDASPASTTCSDAVDVSSDASSCERRVSNDERSSKLPNSIQEVVARL